MKRHMLVKEAVREIWKSRTRFFSILGIVALGVGFFAGVKASCPDMKITMEQYYEETALADVHLVSTYGFNDNDISAIGEVSGIREMMPAYSVDAFVDSGDRTDTIAKVLSIKTTQNGEDGNELNKPVLKEGRLPEKAGECVVEKTINSPENFEIGGTVKLLAGKVDDDILDTLDTDEFTIVGIVESSSFISFDRGKAQIGDGEIDCFIMVPAQDFVLDVYTDVYLTMSDTAGLSPFEQPYKDAAASAVTAFEKVADVRETARYDEIMSEAQEKIDDGKKELEDGKQTQQEELADASKKIDDAQKELDDGQKTLDEKKDEYNTQIAAAQAKLDDARSQTADGEKQYQDGLKQYQDGLKQYEDGLAQFNAQKPAAEQQIAQLKLQADGIRAQIAAGVPGLEGALQQIEQGIVQAQGTLDATQKQLDDSKAELDAAKQTLDESRVQLDGAAAQIVSGQAELDRQKVSGARQLEDAQKKLDDGQKELDDAKKEYNEGKTDSDKEIADAQAELDDAEQELSDVKKPVWYVWDRDNNPGYSSYQDDAEKVDAIAAVFPLFFILVAALVCFTTMTRMVEEQRTQVGTLKALGYSSRAIMSKYLWYAITASVIGSILGLVIGFSLFPKVVIDAYHMRYFMPAGLTPFHWDYAFWCTIVSVAVTGFSAWAAGYKELREQPAQLMRPKAPPSGKRVLLEKWTWLWSKLNFTKKVTIRNIFRYKNRVLMTVIGIAGCTALMLTGFGLQYSIGAIVEKQFNEISVYDALGSLDDETTSDDLVTIQQEVANTPGVKNEMLLYYKGIDAIDANGKKVSATAFVPDEPAEMGNYINLRTREEKQPLALGNDGAIINEKLSKLLKLKVGDTFDIKDADGNEAQAKVSGITENYAMNYVYMTPDYYAQLFGSKPLNNMFAMDMESGTDLSALSETLLGYDHVQGLSYASDTTEQFADMVDSMGSIMLVIIVSAGMLAFIVMYNLVNINVTERMRELATIKVLGFYDKEVSAYIYRENTISAVIGMFVGLVLGVFLEKFVVSTAEVDIVMFAPEIPWTAFVYAGALTLAFAFVVNFVLHFKLKKIDMVESMKSIE
ncbi:MAG: FtsX-like permease family protein [Christensenella sp.]|nr:FtsX-like permease family protein [Christensenella sp.]MEA5004352.1 FtsX-like permease family protein [Christensenella sp.]